LIFAFLQIVEMSTTQSINTIDLWFEAFNFDSFCVISSAIFIVIFASLRSLDLDQLFKKNNDLDDLQIQVSTALLIPLMGSIGLVLFFYFFAFISLLSTFVACISSSIGIVFAVYPFFAKLLPAYTTKETNIPGIGLIPTLCIMLYPLSVTVIVAWLFTGHWALSNTIAFSLCIVAICFIRVPGLKVACIVLGCLFFYDIFWVFFSARFFGQNVMVKVATTAASNPTYAVASTLNISTKYIVPTLQLPMKLIWGDTILGLGDLVVPGLVISCNCRFDKLKGNTFTNGYFPLSVVGYSVGLVCSMVFAYVYNIAQPALLYLVPSTVLPVIALALKRKNFKEIWNGPQDNATTKYQD